MGTQNYVNIKIDSYPTSAFERFKRVMARSFKIELLKGLGLVFGQMKVNHTTQYPIEALPVSPRYRAVHELLRLLESGAERCIGCGLCEKICVSKCIRMDTKQDENGRKAVTDYTINLGRCIFCGYCAEVCPELAIVHGPRYENVSEQRAHFTIKDDMLTPIDFIKSQKEFPGYGAISENADANIKQTPLAY